MQQFLNSIRHGIQIIREALLEIDASLYTSES